MTLAVDFLFDRTRQSACVTGGTSIVWGVPDRLNVACSKCGPIGVPAKDITIETIKKVYRFKCPTCGTVTRTSATPDAIRRLIRAAAVRPFPE